MSKEQAGANSGLFTALKSIAATLLASGKTRLELLGNEIEEEKLRAIRLLLLAQGMAFCFGVGTLLGVALLTALYWESRLLVLSLCGGFFIVVGGVFFTFFKRSMQRPDKVFSTSITELQEDLRQLKAAVAHESPTE